MPALCTRAAGVLCCIRRDGGKRVKRHSGSHFLAEVVLMEMLPSLVAMLLGRPACQCHTAPYIPSFPFPTPLQNEAMMKAQQRLHQLEEGVKRAMSECE